MTKLTIITNNHWRNFLYGYELTEKERSDFDYIDDVNSHSFIRYRSVIYDPDEFMPCPNNTTMRLDYPDFCTWDGYQSDSFFSGVIIRYSPDYEQYQIGTYIS